MSEFSSTVATASTSGVGLQTKTSGRSSEGQPTSSSISLSMRRLQPVQPGGWERVSLWNTSSVPSSADK